MISIIRRLHILRRTMSSTTSTIKIGTHNGHFHCDEIFACSLLKTLPQHANAEIIRLVKSKKNNSIGKQKTFYLKIS